MLYVLLLLSLGCCVIAAAQQADVPPAVRQSASTSKPTPPPIPSLGSVDTFRRILALTPVEREKFLATRTPEQRQIVEWKLREYQAMTQEERDGRLRELQVRVYVRQMIKMPASNRTDYLKMLPPLELKMAQERLAQWDALTPEMQQQVIDNWWAITRIAQTPSRLLPAGMPVNENEMEFGRWRQLPAAEKERVLDHFQRFVEELDERDKSKALNILSDAERQQMQFSLRAFENLPKDKRDRCLEGFKKFAELPSDERAKFLVNVNQWQSMSPKERQSWRVLVSKMALLSAPPLPPGTSKAPPLPPLGPKPSTAVASTNGEDGSGR